MLLGDIRLHLSRGVQSSLVYVHKKELWRALHNSKNNDMYNAMYVFYQITEHIGDFEWSFQTTSFIVATDLSLNLTTLPVCWRNSYSDYTGY